MRIAEAHKWKILRSLEFKPMTVNDLASLMSLGYRAVLNYLDDLHSSRRIHICGYIGRARMRIYALGNKPDVEYVPLKASRKKSPRHSELARLELAAAALAEKPMTAEELGVVLHLCTSRARFYTGELMKATPRRAYVKEFKRSEGKKGWVPVYAAGDNPDAVMPRKNEAQRYRDKIAVPERRERILKKWNERYHAKKKKAQPATWLSALGI